VKARVRRRAGTEDGVEGRRGVGDPQVLVQAAADLAALDPRCGQFERRQQRAVEAQRRSGCHRRLGHRRGSRTHLPLDRLQEDACAGGERSPGHYADVVNPLWIWTQAAIVLFVLAGIVIAIVQLA
jgi:hypothetical protein